MDDNTYVSPGAIAVPVLACITFILDIPPFFWHMKRRNVAAASLVFWVSNCTFFDTINALIWPTADVSQWWPGFVLCDIEAKLMLAAPVGIPGSLACIMRNLALVLDPDGSFLIPTRAQRRKQMAIDSILSIGLPVYAMAIHYIVQPSRYYIFQIAGCVTSFDDSWPTIILVWIWPTTLCLMAVYYSVLVVIRMHKYRRDFSSILNSSSSNLTQSQFKRLFFMSIMLIAIILPVQLYVMKQNVSYPLLPYDWNAIHGPAWWDVIMVPTYGAIYYDRWIHIGVGFAIFFFFGLGKEAITIYRGWLLKAGFGRIFPNLYTPSRKLSNISTTRASFSSRARMFLSKRLSDDSFVHSSRSNSVMSIVSAPSPDDPQKTFPPLYTIVENEGSGRPEASTYATSSPNDRNRLPALSAPIPSLFGTSLAALRMPASSLRLPSRAPLDSIV